MKYKLYLFPLILLLFSININSQAKFTNPVLSGGYPDPSICKVNDMFYLVNSSFEYFPGLPIHQSPDLINWELIGYGLERKSQVSSLVNLMDVQSDGGIHAPSMRYKDGTYYIITTNVYYDEILKKTNMVNFIITADNAAGPWSEPIPIKGAPGIDPDLFFGDDGRVWYVGNKMPENPKFNGEGEIWLQELDMTKFELIGERYSLWKGACGGVWAEGPHIYKKEGKYYLMIAEGGTSFNHAVMIAVSDNIKGPYVSNPRNPIITSRNLSYDNWVNSTGHGDLIELEDGRTYMVLLGIRNEIKRGSNMGRETFLVPVSWEREPFKWKKNKNLWPVVSPETGRVERLNKMVFKNTKQRKISHFRDEFNGDKLKLNWNFRRFPIDDIYRIDQEKGILVLACHPNQISDRGRAALLGFKQTESTYEYTSHMIFNPKNYGSEAGVSMFQKDNNYINFTIIKDQEGIKLKAYCKRDNKIQSSYQKYLPEYSGEIKFKVEANKDNYKLYYNIEGSGFKLLATLDGSIIKSNGYTGAHLGLYASGNGYENQDSAYFNYVNYFVKVK
mgnify:FL=1|tara:strand:- start:58001 stop:59674 length:1674 start_codon:yes stop_codon:yes gene_type:complete